MLRRECKHTELEDNAVNKETENVHCAQETRQVDKLTCTGWRAQVDKLTCTGCRAQVDCGGASVCLVAHLSQAEARGLGVQLRRAHTHTVEGLPDKRDHHLQPEAQRSHGLQPQ